MNRKVMPRLDIYFKAIYSFGCVWITIFLFQTIKIKAFFYSVAFKIITKDYYYYRLICNDAPKVIKMSNTIFHQQSY